jgi:hypothetical protein
MSAVTPDSHTPLELLQRLYALEREDPAVHPDTFWNAEDAFRARLKALSSAEIFALIEAASHEPETDEDRAYWTCVCELHLRPDQDVFDTCVAWTQSDDVMKCEAGAYVMSQLGCNLAGTDRSYPFAAASLPILERLLVCDDPHILSAALSGFAHLGIGDIEKIEPLSRHENDEVRSQVVQALTCRQEPLALAGLIALSKDANSSVRDWATFGLGTQSDADTPAIRDALAERLFDHDVDTRCEALVSLAKRQDPRVIPAILEELARDDVGSLAIEAAGLMPDAAFLPELEAILLTNPDDEDIIAAIEACRSGVAYAR